MTRTRATQSVTVRVFAWMVLSLLSVSCSNSGTPSESQSLRAEYSGKTRSYASQDAYYGHVRNIVLLTGGITHAIPGVHFVGTWVDAGILLYQLDELVYGSGALIARARRCESLVEKGDYRRVLWSAVKGVNATEVRTAAMLALGTKTPFLSDGQTDAVFTGAINSHIGEFFGAKLVGLVAGKILTKKLFGIIPIIGPVAAMSINWYIVHRVNDAAVVYFDEKATVACRIGERPLPGNRRLKKS
jgi:hypothetical protein